MPLENYGVLIGTVDDYYRDPPDNFGKYYHGFIDVAVGSAIYKCAIDVDTQNQNIGVDYRIVPIRAARFQNIITLTNGYHPLASNSTSGALDYYRSTVINPYKICRHPFYIFWKKFYCLLKRLFYVFHYPWKTGLSGDDALNALEALLQDVTRVYIFGEPFDTGLGMHNIHQNQGDPINSQWGPANGIWQDGGTIIQHADGTMHAFLNKFSSQSFKTDDNGHPI